jgi:peptidoglycan/xylan/chitin deacetylase (PgdA/CDA1 family)
MAGSGLCTVANHTLTHVRPGELSVAEIDGCSAVIEQHVGQVPRHFAYPWGIEVPARRAAIAARFRSAVTGRVGRNQPDADRLALRRVPVRQSDPIAFFAAKLDGALVPERTYDMIVRSARRLGVRA